eukprot:snap_masked-scaffold_16-processed-gene-6.78-mRNA-1 protein AED:1.00 eAED:1.00 QI:0/0/0/0/1/1/2/0/308
MYYLVERGVIRPNEKPTIYSSEAQSKRCPICNLTHKSSRCPKSHECGKNGHLRRYCPDRRHNTGQNSNNSRTDHANLETSGKTKASFIAFSAKKENESFSNVFIRDSGASYHFSGDKNLFQSLEECEPQRVATANGNISCIFKGTISFISEDDREVELREVFYHEEMPNLISVSQLNSKGFTVLFENEYCVVESNTSNFSMQIPVEHGVAILRSRPNSDFAATNKIWHNRLNHIAENSIDKLQEKVGGLKFGENKNICEGCVKGKFNREKQKHSNSETIRKPLELIVADSIEGFVGALVLTCAQSNFS